MKFERVPLRRIAYARSGDKGAHANIGVIARSEKGYRFLVDNLDERRVAKFFNELPIVKVKRYLLPNLWAINFVLEGALDGGGSRSLRSDAQGKVLGQAILEISLEVPDDLLSQ